MMIICSAVAGECQAPFQNKQLFEDWSTCMYQGYNDSLELLSVMGDDYINEHEIYIKFACKETIDNSKQTLGYPL